MAASRESSVRTDAAGSSDPKGRTCAEGAAILVFGPTASGKSALAIELARRFGGVIINADSMQLYRELRILTARPTPEDEALVPHALYGIRAADKPSTAAWWREAALREMARAGQRRLVPILCGGTGLYFSALTKGLAAIPDPGPQARAEARAMLTELGPASLHARLAAVDPLTAARLRPSDSQRVARAWEVWRGTGRSLAEWQDNPAAPPTGWRYLPLALDPPRTELRAAITARFETMLAGGAVDEVRQLLSLNLDPALPVMRAHGVREIAAYLRNDMALQAAARRATLVTGQYTKRQATWLRHQPLAPPQPTHMIYARYTGCTQFPKSLEASINHFLCHAG